MGRRYFLTALLLGLLFAISPATASSATLCDGGAGGFDAQLKCWEDQAGKGPVLVKLRGPLQLDSQPANWRGSKRALDRGPLVVSVPGRRGTGLGGTVLLILARKRLVASNSVITPLNDTTLGSLQTAGLCDALCHKLGKGKVSGKELVDDGLGEDITHGVFTTGSQGGGRRWPIIAIPSAALLLLALPALAILRSRRLRVTTGHSAALGPHGAASPPRGPGESAHKHASSRRRNRRTPIPPGPRRRATVRAELHPQGYVELDRCLYRAAWADPDAPPPALGDSVDVVEGVGQDADILLALPPGSGR